MDGPSAERRLARLYPGLDWKCQQIYIKGEDKKKPSWLVKGSRGDTAMVLIRLHPTINDFRLRDVYHVVEGEVLTYGYGPAILYLSPPSPDAGNASHALLGEGH